MPIDRSKNLNYSVDTPETAEIKRYALEVLRADLVGIANIERFANAPLRMSPQGIMPSAKSFLLKSLIYDLTFSKSSSGILWFNP